MKYTHAIVTYSKVHYLLTAEQELKLRGCHMDDEITLQGCRVQVRTIPEVLTIEKYYESYPERRPQRVDQYKVLPGMGFAGVIAASRKQALKGIVRGLNKYISSDRYQGTEEPPELLKMAENRLASINNNATS